MIVGGGGSEIYEGTERRVMGSCGSVFGVGSDYDINYIKIK